MVQNSERKSCKIVRKNNENILVCPKANIKTFNKPTPIRLVPAFSIQSYQKNTVTGSPPKVLLKDKSYDRSTAFRTYYSRGDFPVAMQFQSVGNKIIWKESIDKLNYNHILPIFFDGLRETEYPYKFFASKGIHDLLEHGKDKIIPVLPQLILPLKNALSTRNPEVICETLKVIQHLVISANQVGEALVLYYRQLLPHLNMYKHLNNNTGDYIDYSQMKRENIGDLVRETLQIMEKHGGEHACVNIKYMVPTYESCVIRYNIN